MDEFSARVAAFLSAEKAALRRYRWRSKTNGEYGEAKAVVDLIRIDTRRPVGRLIMTAHRYRQPRKYSFVLMYCNERILGLDVDPARTHTNLGDLRVVHGSHWHTWPCTEAEPEARIMGHRQWFDAFLKRAHIRYPYPYDPPKHGLQLKLPL